ncbi:hypothetical protein FE391_40335 [Nonomuraea sp. KC401]|uniref:hypothetical protein n=1 Tax=unclassified Nonomuraea TaxID=2593643 RepID=UPI0010FD0118|nr:MULTISPECIES: hypothetical protein [unclassified Nonomuraea]NBE99781.1 hypothetical protein [Nonomuraea sp. K271]TLF55655.1 hypothetical protein FE391_40335 [Nonomuraea sp. KC401]
MDHVQARAIALAARAVRQTNASHISGDEAWVTVGFLSEGSPRPLTASVVHPVRIARGAGVSWEVVGASGSKLSITALAATSIRTCPAICSHSGGACCGR